MQNRRLFTILDKAHDTCIYLEKVMSSFALEMCWKRLVIHLCGVSSRRAFFHTLHIKAQIFDLKYWQPQQNCWRRHSPIYKHGLSDWDVLLKGRSRVEECGWTGWWGNECVTDQSVKQTLVAHIMFRWLLLCAEIVQFIYVVLGVTLWQAFFECLAFMNQYRAPFKKNAPFWHEWRCDAVMVPLLYQRS